MAKNLIPRIAEMLGVEMEEAFKIRRPDYEVCENGIYAFFENEGLMKKNEQGEFDNNSSIEFEDLCLGNQEIVKLPWEPKKDERYYIPSVSNQCVQEYFWKGYTLDFAMKALGMVYRTREEAEAHLAEDYERVAGKPLSSR